MNTIEREVRTETRTRRTKTYVIPRNVWVVIPLMVFLTAVAAHSGWAFVGWFLR